MTTYEFRLRFRFPQQSRIAEDAESISLTMPDDGQKVMLQSRPASELINSRLLDAIAGDFPSIEVATSYGNRIRSAIIICCALLGMGVDIDEHEETLDVPHIQIAPSGQGYVTPSSLNGLVVYPQGVKVHRVSVDFSSHGGPTSEQFQKVFVKSFDLSMNLNDRLKLAFELYNSHYFETSIHARFLQLITTIECLSEPRKQPDLIVSHIQNIISSSEQHLGTLEGLSNDDRKYFLQRLDQLKQESISSACRNLVHKHLGTDAVKIFNDCYKIRSKITHKGRTPPNSDLLDHYFKLDQLTRKLLHILISGQT